MTVQNLSIDDVSAVCGLTKAHLYVIAGNLKRGGSITAVTCEKIAKGININPLILNRVIADNNMKVYLESLKESS